MVQEPKKIGAVFYCTSGGAEPVREWLLALPSQDRRIIGFDVATAEFGGPVGMPLCRSLGGGLWEIRSNITRGRIARVIFCIAHGHMILLHAFIKKAQKTPKSELETARKRQKDVEQ